MIVVDRFHYVHQSMTFPLEFGSIMTLLARLLTPMHQPCLQLLLSATVTQADIDGCAVIFSGIQVNVLHGTLNRKSITLKVVVSRDVTRSLKASAECAIQPK